MSLFTTNGPVTINDSQVTCPVKLEGYDVMFSATQKAFRIYENSPKSLRFTIERFPPDYSRSEYTIKTMHSVYCPGILNGPVDSITFTKMKKELNPDWIVEHLNMCCGRAKPYNEKPVQYFVNKLPFYLEINLGTPFSLPVVRTYNKMV